MRAPCAARGGRPRRRHLGRLVIFEPHGELKLPGLRALLCGELQGSAGQREKIPHAATVLPNPTQMKIIVHRTLAPSFLVSFGPKGFALADKSLGGTLVPRTNQGQVRILAIDARPHEHTLAVLIDLWGIASTWSSFFAPRHGPIGRNLNLEPKIALALKAGPRRCLPVGAKPMQRQLAQDPTGLTRCWDTGQAIDKGKSVRRLGFRLAGGRGMWRWSAIAGTKHGRAQGKAHREKAEP